METRGVDPSLSSSCIIGIGLSNEHVTLYIDLREISIECEQWLKAYLVTRHSLTAFNVKFDAGFLQVWTGRWLNWSVDTYGLFKQLSNEGYAGQEWNLETAQLNYLGWDTTNKTAMETALKERGFTKADMWQLPPEILGEYCALDAAAHWQLYEELLTDLSAMPFAETTMQFHQLEYMTMVKLLVEQQLRGIAVDRAGLLRHREYLFTASQKAKDEFLNHPMVTPYLDEINAVAWTKFLEKEPIRLNANGKESVRWLTWHNKHEQVKNTQHFNINSKQQLSWMFYERMFQIRKETVKLVYLTVNGKEYEIEKTGKGGRGVGKSILALFGEPGLLLLKYNKLVKELSYVNAAVGLTEDRGTIHPDYNSFGTVTGRLAGGSDD